MSLADTQIRSSKPREKPYRLFDGGGLYLEVASTGGRWWRLKYRFKGKERRLSMGVYPTVSLKEARIRRDAARKQISNGVDPAAARRAEKEAKDDSVEEVAREWHGKHGSTWSPAHAEKVLGRLQRDAFSWIGQRPVGQVTAPELLLVLRRVEPKGTGNVAHRIHHDLGRIFQYAIATGRAERNPAADLKGALTPVKHAHHPAITEPKEVGELMRAIYGYRGSFVVQCALKLLALTFVRPGELRGAEWGEIDYVVQGQWSIPAERMKMKSAHIVPLSYQARDILGSLSLSNAGGPYVFRGRGRNPISDTTLNAALRSMGYAGKMSAHGFRAMARTLLDEVLGVRPDIIEHQMAHVVPDPLGRAYNRTQHERRAMMQDWADFLDQLKQGADVVPIGLVRRGRVG